MWRDCIQGVKLLMKDIEVVEDEASEHEHEHTPLTHAAAFGQTEILEYLVQKKQI